jgi:hypothetical protein
MAVVEAKAPAERESSSRRLFTEGGWNAVDSKISTSSVVGIRKDPTSKINVVSYDI